MERISTEQQGEEKNSRSAAIGKKNILHEWPGFPILIHFSSV